MTPLTFTRILYAELPFMLNLPTGDYPVQIEGSCVTLHVLQEHCAVPTGQTTWRIVPAAELDSTQHRSAIQLRTLMRLVEVKSIEQEQLTPPPESDLVAELARRSVLRRTGPNGDALLSSAEELRQLDDGARDLLCRFVARRLCARSVFPLTTVDLFVAAINLLVRHYMTEFEDPFAEEIVLHHLASTWTGGVLNVLRCGDELLDSVHYAGRIPPIMRRPWVNHPTERVQRFMLTIASGGAVSSVSLLAARARAFLERGATRSAVIEASASLETAVSRRIRAGFIANGMSEDEATAELRRTQRFSDRCKVTLRSLTGRSLAEVDPALWERVVRHRDEYRHKVSHEDAEPPRVAAERAVQDMIALARVAERL